MHLTYRNQNGHTDDATTDLVVDGAPEIVITEEMTRAGIEAFQRFNPRDDDLEWIVGDVFAAMAKVSLGLP